MVAQHDPTKRDQIEVAALEPSAEVVETFRLGGRFAVDEILHQVAVQTNRPHRHGWLPGYLLRPSRQIAVIAVKRRLPEPTVRAMEDVDVGGSNRLKPRGHLVGIVRQLARDQGQRVVDLRSGYPRDLRVREAVRKRAMGRCEREGCGEQRDYRGFLDVHHTFGVEVSDRVWTCVALCPNCHREAHFAPDRDAINKALSQFARSFVA